MFSRSINDNSKVIAGDATTWSVTFDNSRGVIYDRNIFIIQATGLVFTSKTTYPCGAQYVAPL